MRAHRTHRRSAGFTLIELMVVVGIVGILASLAIGFTTNWNRRNLFREGTREIYHGINTARAEAIRRGRKVRIRFDEDRFTVFIDHNNSNIWDPSNENAIYQYPKAPETWNGAVSWKRDYVGMTVNADSLATANGNVPVFTFDHQGLCLDRNHEPLAASVTIQDDKLYGESNTIDVTIAGAIRIR